MTKLTREQEHELAARVRAGDKQARDEMITLNMGLCGYVANRLRSQSLTHEDLVEYGMVGLCIAVDRFDPVSYPNIKFSTYAVWWIKNVILRSMIDFGSLVRIPAYMYRKLARERKLPDGHISESQGDCPVLEHLAARQELEPCQDSDHVAILEEVLSLFSGKQQDIVRRRLNGDTLGEIAECYRISRERVRQIQQGVMIEIRNQIAEPRRIPDSRSIDFVLEWPTHDAPFRPDQMPSMI